MDDTIRQAFWTELAHSPFVMLRLADADTSGQPMTAQLDKDAHHAVWFFMHPTNDLAPGGAARADVVAKGHKLFASVSGTLTEEQDPAVFDKLWSDQVAAWFNGGKDTAQLMRFDIADAEVWQVDMTMIGMFHLLTGSAIKPGEAGNHATGQV